MTVCVMLRRNCFTAADAVVVSAVISLAALLVREMLGVDDEEIVRGNCFVTSGAGAVLEFFVTIIALNTVIVGFARALTKRATLLTNAAAGVVEDAIVRESCFKDATVGVVVAEMMRLREEVRASITEGVVDSNTALR